MTDAEPRDPHVMAARRVFEILGSAAADACTARLGRMTFAGRRVIDTPNFTAVTSRGAIPHLTPDNVGKHTSVDATYMALEDFVEKKEPPIYKTPSGDAARLHSFTAMPSDRTTIMGARRCPPVTTPMGNSAKSVTLFTSTGFSSVTIPQYAAAIKALRPDVAIPLADALHTSPTPNSKKLIKMVERTEEWLDELLQQLGPGRDKPDALGVSLFAPVLPVEHPIQWDYLRHLAEDVTDSLSGLAVYNVALLPELACYKPFASLPKLSLDPPKTPHDILRQISLGVDMVTVPFINTVSDSGIALTFTFSPHTVRTNDLLPMGVDMWSPEHATAVTPLADGCKCYTCTHHHRAYLHHLLNAKEMLGWNLLQVHNHHIVHQFFAAVRQSLVNGAAAFEEGRRLFLAAYEPELPEGAGERPRARGYHFKSEAGQERRNKSSWKDFDAQTTNGSIEPVV
ncbi:tRNA-guanosine(34) preQ(1) transglycosylase [Purpureocillium takamizusanense]|uniref:Queuine tRNA-ribosyltransferase accessory subunit 2 n=1 Tax=Purpureocillium takamizusanense TaxID=2060973 RepID=A0A9Q8QG93_9HYPO|nr:tRNA-guanosine(34) preQ(1) transglycosylase [Purpureocillium takamizusanense]UNI19080.1 tRNA-guanosine(34) preQ(1) transglycosylase [Purpureocillium takamizusanense]